VVLNTFDVKMILTLDQALYNDLVRRSLVGWCLHTFAYSAAADFWAFWWLLYFVF